VVPNSSSQRSLRVHALCVWLAAVVSLGGCAQSRLPSTPRQPDDDNSNILAKIPESIRNDLEHGRARDVLVELIDRHGADAGTFDAGRYDNEGSTDAPLSRSVLDSPDESVSEKADRYRQLAERVIDQTASDAVSVRFQYENIPMLHVDVKDLAGMISLARNSEVLMVHENVRLDHQLAESLPLINQPAAASAGKLGEGTAVAVLDTGCDYTRAAFGSCSAPGGSCKVAYARDFGVSDNQRDTGDFHGTNVSGIVLGVAPSAKVIALDVFESTQASSSTILQAVDWVISNRTTYNIVAMNMSLGSATLYSANCGNDVFATGITNARNAGVLSAIASGNSASSTGISSPACVPAAVSVGAVWDANVSGRSFGNCSDATTAADKVTCFSNSAPIFSMLAPGALILAAGIPMTGTSQASPHVAGAMAVVRAAFPNETLSATVTRLTSTGPSIRDPRNGVTVHRLDLNAALGGAGTVDVTPPTGTIKINNDAAATKTGTVTLTLSASDEGGAVTMCVSNTASCATFTALAASKSWALPTGDGLKTVYVTYRDANGNKTTVSSSIRLDAVAPTGSQVTSKPGDKQVELSWTAASDAGSGVMGYKVQAASSTTAPSCTTGTTVYTGSATSFTHTGLTNGVTYSYRICPIDNAYNVGTGPSAVARPAPEFDPPTGTVTINQGEQFTNKTTVTLSLTASDASNSVTGMCISNTTTCTTFSAFAASKSWVLASANGPQTVRVWFKDVYGNANITAAASDTIVLDTTPPTASTITAVADDGKVTLDWSAASDALSGLDRYKVTAAPGTTPTCTTGTVAYSGTDRTATLTGLTNGTTYGFRVCPLDKAGNALASGTTASRPAPEFDAPTGTVTINQGAQFTNSKTVNLTLDATDESGVAAVCMSSSTTCSTYVQYATTKTFTVAVATGTATVRVWFKDIYGNVSASPASDTITVDTTAPTVNTLTAVASSGSVALSWAASTDAGSGIQGYRVRMAVGAAPTCTSGTQIYEGTARSYTKTGLTNGTLYGFRVCPYDNVGNVATGGSMGATPK